MIGLKIKDVMIATHMYLSEFATYTGISKGVLSNLMNGINQYPQSKTLIALNEAGINTDYLFNKSDKMFTDTEKGRELQAKAGGGFFIREHQTDYKPEAHLNDKRKIELIQKILSIDECPQERKIELIEFITDNDKVNKPINDVPHIKENV